MLVWIIILLIIILFLISFMIKLHGFVFKTISSVLGLFLIIIIVLGVFVFYDTSNMINEFKESESLFVVFDENKEDSVVAGFLLQSEEATILDNSEINEINYNFDEYKKEYLESKEFNVEIEAKKIFSDYVQEKLIELKKEIMNKAQDEILVPNGLNLTNSSQKTTDETNKKSDIESFDYIFVFNLNDMKKYGSYFVEEYSFDTFLDIDEKIEYETLLNVLGSENSLNTFSSQFENAKIEDLTDQKIRSFVFSQIVAQNQMENQIFLFEQGGLTMYVIPEKIIFKLMKNSIIKESFVSMANLIQ